MAFVTDAYRLDAGYHDICSVGSGRELKSVLFHHDLSKALSLRADLDKDYIRHVDMTLLPLCLGVGERHHAGRAACCELPASRTAALLSGNCRIR